MSFLAGRLAAQEGAYFLHESKIAVGRLAQKLPAFTHGPRQASPPTSPDVFREKIRHSITITPAPPPSDASLYVSHLLGPPTGWRRSCRRVPRRAQPAPFVHLCSRPPSAPKGGTVGSSGTTGTAASTD